MVGWKEPDMADSASCVALGKSLTSWEPQFLSLPWCCEERAQARLGWRLEADDSCHDCSRGEVSFQGQSVEEGDWDPTLLTSTPVEGVCPLTLKTSACGEGVSWAGRTLAPEA